MEMSDCDILFLRVCVRPNQTNYDNKTNNNDDDDNYACYHELGYLQNNKLPSIVCSDTMIFIYYTVYMKYKNNKCKT